MLTFLQIHVLTSEVLNYTKLTIQRNPLLHFSPEDRQSSRRNDTVAEVYDSMRLQVNDAD